MPAENISDVKIGSRACTRAGVGPITTFEDGSAQATVLQDNYDSVVDNALSLYPWQFARKLVDLGAPVADVEIPQYYDNLYQLPDECFKLWRLDINDTRTTEYEILGLRVACYAGPNDSVRALYTYRADESIWHPTFVEYVVYKLASLLATGVAHDAKRAELFEGQADLQWRRARHAVSIEDTNLEIRSNQLVTTRFV